MDKEIAIPTDLQEMLDVLMECKREEYYGNIKIIFVKGEVKTWWDNGVHKIGEKK